MRRNDVLTTVLLGALLAVPAAMSPRAGAQDPSAAEKPAADKNGSKDVRKQWAELLLRREKLMKALEGLDEKFQSSDKEGKKKIQADFEKLNNEFQNEIAPGLKKIGPAIFKQDPADPIAAQIVLGGLLPKKEGAPIALENLPQIASIVKGLSRNDRDSRMLIENMAGLLLQQSRYADVMEITDRLAEAKDVNPRLLVIDSMAHFNSNEFEKAKELSKRAAKADPAATAGVDGFTKNCDEHADFWKRELEIRAKEARADDLPRVLFKTSKGDIVLELFENEAPNTVANFISLVEGKKYDGIKFHRVDLNFVAQAGDPNTLDDDPSNDGKGGPGYTIACECYSEKARKHFQGSLSMAHAGKDTGGSQFFLTHCPTPHLNWAPGKSQSNHTVFGRILEGLDVALALRVGDVIESATVIRKRDHAYVPVKSGQKKK